ncbi:unnamed protein product [Lactuca virosa]|uniref:Replication protein A OB domain-containing protein n=1 Tax=Lactuca virosa TaxID=75947 RepID=A0AAU9PR19_9ASTR|nr:unnamed protein product [Lactuca virosa]
MRVIVEHGREKRLMNLVAQDLSGTKIAVALWDSFALKLNTYISQHHNETAPVIILLRLAKLKIWGGQPQVGNCLFGSRLHINDDMPHILEFKSNLNALDMNVESSSRSSQLNSDTVVANPEDYYLRFQIKNIDEIPDLNEDQGRQQIPDEFKILLNKKFVFKVQISIFNLQNNYRAYTMQKLTDDERVLAAVFKRSPNHEHHILNDNGTLINKPNKDTTDFVHDDNLDVVDLEALTSSSSTGKRPISINANTDSLEWSSSKTSAIPATLNIPKLEKLD